MSVLIVRSGKHRGRKLRLPKRFERIVIGRSGECQVRLNHEGVSPEHCLLSDRGQGLVARDLGSQTGTFVNEERIEGERTLKPGDVLRIGPVQLQLAPESSEEHAGPQTSAAKAHPVDEDVIVDWLLEGGGPALAGERPTTAGQTTAAPPTAVPKPPKKFASLAEEAADIIRRWKEMESQRTQPES
ncbi:MAG TPA: FHA domain-containing protein [Planctomycetaceae bacterium]|nr:FHA domain-containing protein [Planctomycetaceae bacterium]